MLDPGHAGGGLDPIGTDRVDERLDEDARAPPKVAPSFPPEAGSLPRAAEVVEHPRGADLGSARPESRFEDRLVDLSVRVLRRVRAKKPFGWDVGELGRVVVRPSRASPGEPAQIDAAGQRRQSRGVRKR